MDSVLANKLQAGVMEVDGNWRIGYANAAARKILAREDALRVTGVQVEFSRAADRARAERWLRACIAAEPQKPLGLPRSSGRVPYLLDFVGPCESASCAAEGRFVLLLIDPERPPRVDPAVLVEVLALTPAEAALAAALATGHSLQEFSAKAAVTEGTARRHLERIFLKTGVERQAALVRLVLCCASPLGEFALNTSANAVSGPVPLPAGANARRG
jgi:DNA-binding CsgD family transcriptional regulator